jgi:hypothetical protein
MEQDKLAGDGAVETKIKPWDEYFKILEKRLEAGAKEYGNKSFDKSVNSLIEEIQQEILDIAGWSYILWEKLERMK